MPSATVLGLSPRQKFLRSTGLGASEVPTALGINPWKSPAELAEEKRGVLEPSEAGEAAMWGHIIERPIADHFIERRRAEGKAWSIFTPPTLRHPTCDLMLATLDRVIVPEGRRARETWISEVECKNFSAYRSNEFRMDEEIPEPVLVQLQVQMEVVGFDYAWLAVLIGGQQYQERQIPRDREMGGMLVQFVEKWWADHVVQGLPCEPDGSEAYAGFLRRRYPSNLAPALPLTPEAAQLVAAARAAKAELAQAEEREAEAVAKLKALIGEAEGVQGLCTWKNNKPSTKTDFEAAFQKLVADSQCPAGTAHELVQQFTTTKPGARVLRLSKGA